MKIYSLLLWICFTSFLSKAQIGVNSQWTWMKGDSTTNSIAIYGTQGTASIANKPGTSEASVSWKDASGNLWLFDGVLWKYELSMNQWTWIKGDHTVSNFGVYGDLGVPAAANQPGARNGSVSWTDLTGNFWLFGGIGYGATSSGLLNDLWKYNLSTNQWTWVNGDSIPDIGSVYGTQGVPDFGNKPGNRAGCVSWADVSGNLWLFGGGGYPNTGSALPRDFNEVWKYNPTTNQWTFVRGEEGPAEYGTQGVASPANHPGPRHSSVSWTDGSGNLWLFGGASYFILSLTMENYNDLWKYDPILNQWTWMKGDNTPNADGIYGIQGTGDDSNTPGSRDGSATWRDASGNLWLFGGELNYSSFGDLGVSGIFNDLWKYDLLNNQWIWVKGDNNMLGNYGVYGVQNIPASTNKPGSRYNAVSWADNSGNFWLFGGSGNANSEEGSLNDLWILGDPSTVPVTFLDISATVVQNNILVKWQTSQEINTSHFIVERSTDGRNFSLIGSVIASGNSSSLIKYSFTDQQPMPGINYYRVKMVDKDNYYKSSSIVRITLNDTKNNITVYPNPVISAATINVTTHTNAELKFGLYDHKGSLVSVKQIFIVAGNNSFAVDMSKLSKGIYTAVIIWGSENKNVQILKN